MILGFVIAAILIELTPGPNMTWLAVLGANHGQKPALAAVGGIGLGLAAAALVAGFGLTALLYQVPQLHMALRWAGTIYLLYLAWEAWRDSDGHDQTNAKTASTAFMQGFVSNILNPKAYLFYATVLPQFIDGGSSIGGQVSLLSAIYVAVATTIHAGIALSAGGITEWLDASPRATALRKVMALLIALAAVWFFYSTGVSK